MNKIFGTCIKSFLLVILIQSSQVAAEQFAVVADPLPSQTGMHKPGLLSKADNSLARVFEEFSAHIDQGKPTAFQPSSKFLHASLGGILIDARATSNGGVLLDELIQLGLTNGARYGDVVSGLLPFVAIEDALALSSLRSITASPRPIRHAGSITSQGDVALRADVARTTYAVDGTGVTVGVVSDSYDYLGGAAADVLSGDLPTGGVTVPNGESIYCGAPVFCVDEGRAMLQIIHDVAPGAGLLFQSGIDGIASYANAIINLAASGADIIVDDLLIINEPMFQDGVVAQAIDSVVASGVSYFSAAGNSGRQSYQSAFDDSGEIFCIEFFEPIGDCDPTFERVGRMHDFDPGPGVDNYQSITIPVNGIMTIAMQWDQPYGGSGPQTDHDIVLLDGTGQTFITLSANDNVINGELGMGEGWEALQFNNNEVLDYGTDFTIMITYDDVDSVGPPASLVKLVIFGEGITINEYATNSSALYGHSNAVGAEAVGAAFFMDTPANGTSPPVLETYSSAGGTPILFDIDGTPLGTPEVRQKPEITAVDGVNTTFFFDDSYGGDGIDDFFGTSAAAPHAAGVAALLLEARPGVSPDQINSALENTAADMGTAGFDYDSGFGLIQADAAIAAVLKSDPDLTAFSDVSGDGTADFASFIDDGLGGGPKIDVLSGANGSTVSTISFFNVAWTGRAIESAADGNSDGVANDPAIAVLGFNPATSATIVQVRMAMTGAFVRNIQFFNPAWTKPLDIIVIDDVDGDGNTDDAAIGVLALNEATNAIAVQVKRLSNGSTIATRYFLNPAWSPRAAAAIVRSGQTPLIGVMAVNPVTGSTVVQSRQLSDGAVQANTYYFNVAWRGTDVAVETDLNSDGTADDPAWMVMATNDSSNNSAVQVRSVNTGAMVKNIFFLNPAWEGDRVTNSGDISGNMIGEVAGMARNRSNGNIVIQVRDYGITNLTRNIFP